MPPETRTPRWPLYVIAATWLVLIGAIASDLTDNEALDAVTMAYTVCVFVGGLTFALWLRRRQRQSTQG